MISSDKAPKIVSHLESRCVKDGDAVTLACRIIGAEHFDVVWLHNNKEIKPSKDFQYTNEANIYRLQIAEIFPKMVAPILVKPLTTLVNHLAPAPLTS